MIGCRFFIISTLIIISSSVNESLRTIARDINATIHNDTAGRDGRDDVAALHNWLLENTGIIRESIADYVELLTQSGVGKGVDIREKLKEDKNFLRNLGIAKIDADEIINTLQMKEMFAISSTEGDKSLKVSTITRYLSVGNDKSINGTEDYGSVCGNKWQSEYTKLHNSIIKKAVPGRYILAVPVKAGLADIFLGYISAFLWSLLTNRALLIMHIDSMDNCEAKHKSTETCRCNQRSIEVAYDSPNINWTAPTIPRGQYRCLMPPYTLDVECDADKEFVLWEHDGNKSKVVQYNQVNTGFQEEFARIDMSEFPREHHDTEIIMLASNRGVSYNIFDNPFNSQTLRDMGLERETAFPCIFNYLFKLKDDVCSGDSKKVESQLIEAGKSGVIRIGIQVRNTEADDAPEHFFCVDSLVTYYEGLGKKVLILLVTASHRLQVFGQKYYGDKIIFPNGKPSDVVSVHDREDDRSDEISKDQCVAKRRLDEEGMRHSARDAYLLSLTDMQVISRSSGFGVLGGMSRPRSHPIMFHMALSDKGVSLRHCNATLNGDSLAVFANSWSGL